MVVVAAVQSRHELRAVVADQEKQRFDVAYGASLAHYVLLALLPVVPEAFAAAEEEMRPVGIRIDFQEVLAHDIETVAVAQWCFGHLKHFVDSYSHFLEVKIAVSAFEHLLRV
jgi:hypothetical protein